MPEEAPVIKLELSGTKQVNKRLRAHVTYTDAPPPESRSAASGVVIVVINWGDGGRFNIVHWSEHAYKRPGRYTITVIVSDRAGNKTTVVRHVKITEAAPARKPPGKRR